jgi:peptide/nickel transport system substrate-binding protein
MLNKLPRLCAGIVAAAMASAPLTFAQTENPQYGGSLDIGTVNYTLSPLSWDTADWAWKTNQDALYLEQLFAGDLSKALRSGGKYRFTADSWLPSDAIRGELAETWQWKESPLRLEIVLRKGVMFPAKPGVMAARELIAEDVVFSYQRLAKSPKRVADFLDHIDKVEATDRHTVVFSFNKYQSDWDYRYGWGYFSPIVPREVVDAGAANWRNANGSGPFQLVDYIQGNSLVFAKNASYWDKERIAGQEYAIPFVDRLTTRIIKDESTALTALRTAKLDILESVRWTAVDELKQHAPALRWNRRLSTAGQYLSMRVDTKPFDDIRVRRALNIAVNKPEIVTRFYGGNAELFAFPQTPDFIGYHEPLEAMPDSIKELYVYNPDKAKQLLAEAGYPNGFSFKVQVCSCAPDLLDLIPMLAAYLQKVGVRIEVQQMEYGALFSLMRSGTNAAGLLVTNGFGNPTQTLRKNFLKGQYVNTSLWDDKAFEAKLATVYTERDEAKQQATIKALSREIIDKAPYIWLPTPYAYTAWWPWVKNYEGELFVGSARAAPIYARIWVDQAMKKKMGF